MRKLIQLLLVVALASVAWGQQTTQFNSGFISSTQCVLVPASGLNTGSFSITGSWTGTLTAYGAVGQGAPTSLSSQTGNGSFTVTISGYTLFEVCGNSVATGTAFVQVYASVVAGSGGSNLPAGTIAPAIVQTGLLAQYDFNQGSGTSLTDKSGSGNNGTLCAGGNAPTWNSVASGGGLVFTTASATCVTLPSALNSAQTIQLFIQYQQQNTTATTPFFPYVIVGNGATTASTVGAAFLEGGAFPGFPNQSGTIPDALSPLIYLGNTGGSLAKTVSGFTGTGMLTWVLDAAHDLAYIDNIGPLSGYGGNVAGGGLGGHSQGIQSSGVYQLGGRASGYVNGNSSYWTGTIYYALFYSGELTTAQVLQNYQAVSQAMQQRGIPQVCATLSPVCAVSSSAVTRAGLPAGLGAVYSTTGSNANVIMSDGDSEDAYNNGYFQYLSPSQTEGSFLHYYISNPGMITPSNPGQDPWATCQYVSPNGLNIAHIWWGQNEPGGTGFINRLAAHAKLLRSCGYYVLIATQLNGSNNAGEQTNNSLTRQNWPGFADALADIGESPSLGANNASANTNCFPDALHLTVYCQSVVAGIWQRTLNHYILGNLSFSTANTYTTTAPAATTITAATDATGLVTFTFAAIPAGTVIGSDLYITGVTPAGYNTTSADTICHVLSTTATTVTCRNTNTSLGAGSAFGAASLSTQLDVDTYVILGGAATSPVFTLNTCQGMTDGKIYIKNANTTSPWVIESNAQFSGAYTATETIDGANTLTMPTASSGNNPVVILQATLIAGTTGGCVWKRIQ